MKRAFIISLLTFTAGCSVGPEYVKPQVDTPQHWRVDIQQAENMANVEWWKSFNDPILDELVQTALQNNRDVRIAAARVAEFAARVDIARSGFYPQIGYAGTGSRDQFSSNTATGGGRLDNNFQATLNVGWELDFWGKLQHATDAARADLLSIEEGRRSVILTLVSAVATSYVELRNLDKQLQIAKSTLQRRAETITLFEDKFKGGVISDLEVAQVRSEYEQAAVRIPSIEKQIALLENALSVLLARNPGPIRRGKQIDSLAQPAVPAGIPSSVLLQRPDIHQAEQILISSNAQVGVARALYYPNISLTGLFGYASNDLSDLFQGSSNIWSFGGSLLGPLFAGGRIDAQNRAADAVKQQALLNYLQTVQTAFREVDDALVSTRKSVEELDALGRQVDALKNYARYARSRYNEGYVSYIEVIDAERQLFDSELAYTQQQRDALTSYISIYKAMGGGWVTQAEASANLIDYPAPDNDEEKPFYQPLLDFPPRTLSSGEQAAAQQK
ncbi:MAG: efflux transporter outer membrane subunit [gamma proteobacterium symbiont of Bathyaustriella thionipta]|nr:efflux transporter outer membrane subunit [gamma proteobacterium symbiont of Bathyaustriella thionipta]